MTFDFKPLRFAGIYIAVLAGVAALGFVLARFDVDLPSSIGAITVMIAAMFESQRATRGLSEMPATGLWRAALIMNVIAVAISAVIVAGMISTGFLDMALFGLVTPSTWAIISLIVLAAGLVMARLGIRVGAKGAIAATRKGA